MSQLKSTAPDSEQNDIDDEEDFFDALPVIVLPGSPQVSSPESSLTSKDSAGSRLDSTAYTMSTYVCEVMSVVCVGVYACVVCL